ncbi:MAG: DUF362 domain-containing protein [Phycisphaerales bacterium]|jgi:hypothetical protein
MKSEHQTRRCSKTGKIINSIHKHKWAWWLSPFIGLAALIWFLVRVIPKPSRATYPCQRVAFPLASGFVAWLIALVGSAAAYKKAKVALVRSRYVAAAICIAVSIGFIWGAMNTTNQNPVYAHEPIVHNSPIGDGKGIYPGRVAWMHNPDATDWDGPGSGNPRWYTDDCTDPDIVAEMLSDAIQALTGRDNDANAWDAVFRNFNQRKGKGYVGYTPGEKIAIKINFVLMYGQENWPSGNKPFTRLDQIDNSPQLAIALIKQLTDVVGVEPEDISLIEACMVIANYWHDMVAAECPGVVFVSKEGYPLSGVDVTYDLNAPFYWSEPDANNFIGVTKDDHIPTHFSQAAYLINFPILKSHAYSAITLAGKNHFGSLRTPNQQYYYDMHNSRPLEVPQRNRYRSNVDLMGHPRLGGKTLLVLIDGLYAGQSWDSQPIKWDMAPFNGDWPSSIFLSQDQVAADSVAFDFMDYEWDTSYPQMPGADDYLHEAALIPDPCSGVTYDPNGDGGLTESLGVHEHWNNATDKQYSRNLDPLNGTGIELVTESGPVGDFHSDGVVDFKDFAVLASAWGSEPGDDQWQEALDLVISGKIDEDDLAAFCDNWLM